MSGALESGVRVCVVRADNLKKVDTLTHADPYVKLYVNGNFLGKTKIKKNKKSPEWNETFEVPETISAEGLVLEVYDWNAIAKDKFLGLVKLTSLGAYHGRENVEFELQPREGGGAKNSNKHVQGQLYLSFASPNDNSKNVAKGGGVSVDNVTRAVDDVFKGGQGKPLIQEDGVAGENSGRYNSLEKLAKRVGKQDGDGGASTDMSAPKADDAEDKVAGKACKSPKRYRKKL